MHYFQLYAHLLIHTQTIQFYTFLIYCIHNIIIFLYNFAQYIQFRQAGIIKASVIEKIIINIELYQWCRFLCSCDLWDRGSKPVRSNPDLWSGSVLALILILLIHSFVWRSIPPSWIVLVWQVGQIGFTNIKM